MSQMSLSLSGLKGRSLYVKRKSTVTKSPHISYMYVSDVSDVSDMSSHHSDQMSQRSEVSRIAV